MFFVINNRFFRNIFKPGGLPPPPRTPLESRFADTAAAARHGRGGVRHGGGSLAAAATENIFDVFDVSQRFKVFKRFRPFLAVFGCFLVVFPGAVSAKRRSGQGLPPPPG